MVIDIVKQIIIIDGAFTTTFLGLAAAAAYMDIRKRRIPDKLTGGIFLTGVAKMAVVCSSLVLYADGWYAAGSYVLEHGAGALTASVPMLLAALAFPGAFGGGDVKLMAACGFYMGAEDIFYAFFYALVLAGIYGVWLILYKNKSKKVEVAFGLFLTLGMLIRLIFCAFWG